MTGTETAKWWDENVRQAGDNLEEYFAKEIETPSYADSFYVAQNVLLLAAPMLVLDPTIAESAEDREQIWKNLLRLQDLARRVYKHEHVDEVEIVKGKWLLAHFEPVGDLAIHALMACRYALSSILMTNASVVMPEQFSRPGPEAWCLAMHAYSEIAQISEEDYEGRPKDSFWVRVDDEFAGQSRAHQVNKLMGQMGGTPVSPN